MNRLNDEVLSANRLPGSEKFTSPRNVKGLSKFLKEIKDTQESHTDLDDTNLIMFGSKTSLMKEIDRLPQEETRDYLTDSKDLRLYNESDFQPGNFNIDTPLKEEIVRLTDDRELNLDSNTINLNANNEPQLIGDSIGLNVDKNYSLYDDKLELDVRKNVKLSDEVLQLSTPKNTSLREHLEKLHIDKVNSLSNKRDSLPNNKPDVKLSNTKQSLTVDSNVELSNYKDKISPTDIQELSNRKETIAVKDNLSLDTSMVKLTDEGSIELDNSVKTLDNITGVDRLPEGTDNLTIDAEVKLSDDLIKLSTTDINSLESTKEVLFTDKEINSLSTTRLELVNNNISQLNLETYEDILDVEDNSQLSDTRVDLITNDIKELSNSVENLPNKKSNIDNLSDSIVNLTSDKPTPELYADLYGLEDADIKQNLISDNVTLPAAVNSERQLELPDYVDKLSARRKISLNHDNLKLGGEKIEFEDLPETTVNIHPQNSPELDDHVERLEAEEELSLPTKFETIISNNRVDARQDELLDIIKTNSVNPVLASKKLRNFNLTAPLPEDLDSTDIKNVLDSIIKENRDIKDEELFNRVIKMVHTFNTYVDTDGKVYLKEGEHYSWVSKLEALVTTYLGSDNFVNLDNYQDYLDKLKSTLEIAEDKTVKDIETRYRTQNEKELGLTRVNRNESKASNINLIVTTKDEDGEDVNIVIDFLEGLTKCKTIQELQRLITISTENLQKAPNLSLEEDGDKINTIKKITLAKTLTSLQSLVTSSLKLGLPVDKSLVNTTSVSTATGKKFPLLEFLINNNSLNSEEGIISMRNPDRQVHMNLTLAEQKNKIDDLKSQLSKTKATVNKIKEEDEEQDYIVNKQWEATLSKNLMTLQNFANTRLRPLQPKLDLKIPTDDITRRVMRDQAIDTRLEKKSQNLRSLAAQLDKTDIYLPKSVKGTDGIETVKDDLLIVDETYKSLNNTEDFYEHIPEYQLSDHRITLGPVNTNIPDLNPNRYLRWVAEETINQIFPDKSKTRSNSYVRKQLLEATLAMLVCSRDIVEKAMKVNRFRLPGNDMGDIMSQLVTGDIDDSLASKVIDKFTNKVKSGITGLPTEWGIRNRPTKEKIKITKENGKHKWKTSEDRTDTRYFQDNGVRKPSDFKELQVNPKSIQGNLISFRDRYLENAGMATTLSELTEYKGLAPDSLEQLKEILINSPYISTPNKYMSTKGSFNIQTLSSNCYWEITLEPFVHRQMNGGFSFLPSFREINVQNMRNHGANTGYNVWLPIIGFDMDKSRMLTKTLGLYDGEIVFPSGVEFTNELTITMLNDNYKSWGGFWRKVMEVSVYNSEPHQADFYRELYPAPTAVDKSGFCIALYKNVTWRCRVYILSPQYTTIKKFDLLVVLKEFSESYSGDIDSPGGDVTLKFSIVGENPPPDHEFTKLPAKSRESVQVKVPNPPPTPPTTEVSTSTETSNLKTTTPGESAGNHKGGTKKDEVPPTKTTTPGESAGNEKGPNPPTGKSGVIKETTPGESAGSEKT